MMHTNLCIATFNVHGLGSGAESVKKQCQIKRLLETKESPPNVILLQEHFMTAESCQKRTRHLPFRGGKGLWNPATISPLTTRLRGGTSILLSAQLEETIQAEGIIQDGRAQYVVLRLQTGMSIGLINVYASNQSSDRAELWNTLLMLNLEATDWILAGDFNMLESQEDKRGGAEKLGQRRREKAVWQRVLSQYGLSDAGNADEIRKQVGHHFTWNNRRAPPNNIEARLDRFYVSHNLLQGGGKLSTMANLPHLSDHAPVICELFTRRSTRQHTYRFDTSLLKVTEAKQELMAAWHAEPKPGHDELWGTWLAATLERVQETAKELTKSKRKHRFAQEKKLQARVRAAEGWMQREPQAQDAREIHAQALAELEQIMMEEVDHHLNESACHWFRYGDRCTKQFFNKFKTRMKTHNISELDTEQGILTEQEHKLQYITSFYSQLYAKGEEGDGIARDEAREKCWNAVPRSVNTSVNKALTRPLVPQEITEAIASFPKGKAPGVDGIPMEFFQEFSDDILSDLLEVTKEVLRLASFSKDLNKGLITLIPKGGNHSQLTNLRPITLLGSFYKIVAKVLANRLQDHLQYLIRPNQVGFVRGRCIIDNMVLVNEAMDWADQSSQEMAIVLLDFDKAYDRVNWQFLEHTLLKMGFEEQWVGWVLALYTSASAAVKVNGEVGAFFEIKRSVRQGCPLAPYLFILVADVLGYMLEEEAFNIKGLNLPGGGVVRDQSYADDTALYLQGSEDNLSRAEKVIQIFCEASGAKVNWQKTTAIWVSTKPRTHTWGTTTGLKWIEEGTTTKYLGFQVGYKASPCANMMAVYLRIKGQLARWAAARLSLAGRILVANQVILASIWYLVSCWKPSKEFTNFIRSLVRNFVWSGREAGLTRAKVSWASAISQTSEGGVKLIDPMTQAEALLSKLLIRGLTPGEEPWKVFFKAAFAKLQPTGKTAWPPAQQWLTQAKALRSTSHSALMQALLKIWPKQSSFLKQETPQTPAHILRQPLFGNKLIVDEQGFPLGLGGHKQLDTWASSGITAVGHLWNWEAQTWLGWNDIREQLPPKARHTGAAVCHWIISRIPWTPRRPLPPAQGTWLSSNQPGRPKIAYHITESSESSGKLQAWVFSIPPTHNKLIQQGDRPAEVPDSNLNFIRVIQWSKPAKGFTNINPKTPVPANDTVWLYEDGYVTDLPWDPGEWLWRKLGHFQEAPFYTFSARRGYAQGIQHLKKRPKADSSLQSQGFNEAERKQIFSFLWHKTRPKNLNTFLWLSLSNGLATGDWLEKTNAPGVEPCQACSCDVQETPSHCFFDCSFTKKVWASFDHLCRAAGIGTLFRDYPSLLVGKFRLYNPKEKAGRFTYELQPWDLLRAFLLWFIWKERCSNLFQGEVMSQARILNRAWLATIQVGMATWKAIHVGSRTQHTSLIEDDFIRYWCTPNIFCWLEEGLKWRFTPHMYFNLN